MLHHPLLLGSWGGAGPHEECLDDPSFDRLAALQSHQVALEVKRERLEKLSRRWMNIYGNRYDPAKYLEFAEAYEVDERFTACYDKWLPGCVRFLRDAVLRWIN